MPKHFLRDDDLNPAEQTGVLDLADAMRKDRFGYQILADLQTARAHYGSLEQP